MATDSKGTKLITRTQEKGIDVLCALAVIRETHDPATDVVILASQDSDLEPCLDEALLLGTVKVETASWFHPKRPRESKEIRPTDLDRRIWNTRLSSRCADAATDRTSYE